MSVKEVKNTPASVRQRLLNTESHSKPLFFFVKTFENGAYAQMNPGTVASGSPKLLSIRKKRHKRKNNTFKAFRIFTQQCCFEEYILLF